jgi:5-methylcytosine-specific restriction endonuclease McrA
MALALRCLGCGQRTRTGSYCPRCAKTTARGYGWHHQQRARATVAASPRCEQCGRLADLTADHIIPVIDGGAHGPLRVLCRPCNSSRGRNPIF